MRRTRAHTPRWLVETLLFVFLGPKNSEEKIRNNQAAAMWGIRFGLRRTNVIKTQLQVQLFSGCCCCFLSTL
jgi:hypothetical protein